MMTWLLFLSCVCSSYAYGFPGRKDTSDGTNAGMPSAVAMTRVEDLGNGNYTLSYQVRTRSVQDETYCGQIANAFAFLLLSFQRLGSEMPMLTFTRQTIIFTLSLWTPRASRKTVQTVFLSVKRCFFCDMPSLARRCSDSINYP